MVWSRGQDIFPDGSLIYPVQFIEKIILFPAALQQCFSHMSGDHIWSEFGFCVCFSDLFSYLLYWFYTVFLIINIYDMSSYLIYYIFQVLIPIAAVTKYRKVNCLKQHKFKNDIIKMAE